MGGFRIQLEQQSAQRGIAEGRHREGVSKVQEKVIAMRQVAISFIFKT
jgi:hypothetical protein